MHQQAARVTSVDESRLARIRKLLAQAEDPACTRAEAEAFTAKAADLMARHGIDEALLASSDPQSSVVGDLVIDLLAPYAGEKASLGSVVADAMRCRAVMKRSRGPAGGAGGRTEHALHLFGHTSDLVLAEILFTSLLVQASRDLGRTPVPPLEHPAAFRRTWWLGFASAVGTRLRRAGEQAASEAEARFEAQGTSTSLVLAHRTALAERAMWETYPNLRPAASRRLSGGGHAFGWEAGQRASLGTDPAVDAAGRRALGRG